MYIKLIKKKSVQRKTLLQMMIYLAYFHS